MTKAELAQRSSVIPSLMVDVPVPWLSGSLWGSWRLQSLQEISTEVKALAGRAREVRPPGRASCSAALLASFKPSPCYACMRMWGPVTLSWQICLIELQPPRSSQRSS